MPMPRLAFVTFAQTNKKRQRESEGTAAPDNASSGKCDVGSSSMQGDGQSRGTGGHALEVGGGGWEARKEARKIAGREGGGKGAGKGGEKNFEEGGEQGACNVLIIFF